MTPDNNFGREGAWQLLCEWTTSESLRKHALGVEACVSAYAEKYTHDLGIPADEATSLIDLWSATALLHDFDYEKHPSQQDHPFIGVRVLEEQGWPEEMRTAILGHADYSGVPRESALAKTLYACDELSGFLTACALVKPTKSIADVEVHGVKKKLKDRAFAKGVNREDVLRGAAELGVNLDDHIAFCIRAMQKRATDLGLAGGTGGS